MSKTIGESLKNIKRIVDEALKDYTFEERKQLKEETLKDLQQYRKNK